MGPLSLPRKCWFSVCEQCKLKNVIGKETGKPANIGLARCRKTSSHTADEYILTKFPKGARVGWTLKVGSKQEWHTYVVDAHWVTESEDGKTCTGGLILTDETDRSEVKVEYRSIVKGCLRVLPTAFAYETPYTIHAPGADVSQAEFFELVETAGKATTAHDFVAIDVAGHEALPVGQYLNGIEPLGEYMGEVRKQAKFNVICQHGRNSVDVVMTATELLEKLKTTEMGSEPRGTPGEEVAAAQAAQHPVDGTREAEALYIELADWKNSPRHQGDIRPYKPASFSENTPYVCTLVQREHRQQWVLLKKRLASVKTIKAKAAQDLELQPDLSSDSDADTQDEEEQEHDNKRVSILSATNWAWGTPRERQRHRSKKMSFVEQLKGATMGGPLIATAGAGTVVHQEQACLSSANVCFSGRKLWYYGNGLRRWRDENDGDLDLLSKDVLAFPTVAECERYQIKVFVQTAGTVVLTRAGLPHTVLSLTTTVAEATNLVLDEHDWVSHLVQEVGMYLPLCYPDPIKPTDASKELGKLSEKQETAIARLSTWVRHTGDYLRVQANCRSKPKPFEKCRVGDIVDVGSEQVAVYVIKTTSTELVYVLPVNREEHALIDKVPFLSFRPANARTIPLKSDDGAGDEAGGRHTSVEVSRVPQGLVDNLSADELYNHVADPEHYGQLQACQEFGLPKGLYEGPAVGKSLVIGISLGWARGTPPPHQEKVRRVPSTTRLLHTNTHVCVLHVGCALLSERCSLQGP